MLKQYSNIHKYNDHCSFVFSGLKDELQAYSPGSISRKTFKNRSFLTPKATKVCVDRVAVWTLQINIR